MTDVDLVVIGDCNPDLLVRGGEVMPQFGQAERLVDEMKLTIGGSGGICASGAARLGLRVAMVGVLGDDVFGQFMRESLAARGVDVSAVRVDRQVPTGLTIHLLTKDDRAMLTHPGTIERLRAEDIDPAVLTSARHVHVSSYFLQSGLWDGLPGLLSLARSTGATTSLDPNWDPSGSWDRGLSRMSGLLSFLLPNGAEAIELARAWPLAGPLAGAGREPGDCAPEPGDREARPGPAGPRQAALREPATPGEAACMLAAAGPTVAVKLGADGALAASPGGRLVHVAAVPGLHPADSVGAGDSFDAGFLAAALWGWDIRRALALGAACGALSTRAPGGTGGQPARDEAAGLAERLLADTATAT
jgi:sugar/nucleoside kinase (ribokinase family)